MLKYDTMSPRKRKTDLEREIRELKAELSIAKKQIGEPNDIDNDNDASENTEWRDGNEVSIHTGVKVQLPPQEPYNGTGRSWESFISSFRNLAATCGWEESEQRVRLLACLRGDAADFVFQQLAPDDIADFVNLISALEHRFAARKTPSTFVSQLELRRLGQRESIADYAADIRRLTTFGYPTADAATREMIGTRHFLRGLGDSSMAMAIGMREPATLQEAREIAERFHHLQEESGRGARQIRSVSATSEDAVNNEKYIELRRRIISIDERIEQLTKLFQQPPRDDPERPVRQPREQQPRDRPPPRCYNCQKLGHLARNCRVPPQNGGQIPAPQYVSSRPNWVQQQPPPPPQWQQPLPFQPQPPQQQFPPPRQWQPHVPFQPQPPQQQRAAEPAMDNTSGN